MSKAKNIDYEKIQVEKPVSDSKENSTNDTKIYFISVTETEKQNDFQNSWTVWKEREELTDM